MKMTLVQSAYLSKLLGPTQVFQKLIASIKFSVNLFNIRSYERKLLEQHIFTRSTKQ